MPTDLDGEPLDESTLEPAPPSSIYDFDHLDGLPLEDSSEDYFCTKVSSGCKHSEQCQNYYDIPLFVLTFRTITHCSTFHDGNSINLPLVHLNKPIFHRLGSRPRLLPETSAFGTDRDGVFCNVQLFSSVLG